MKVCIVGAGAIGGFIGTRLAMAGHDVGALARGATLDALRKHGWRLRQDGQLHRAPARASDRIDELGPQDLVVIAVKGQSLPDVAPRLKPLLEPHTLVLPAMNGVPWWFGRGVPALESAPLASVDPAGIVSKAIPFEQVIGCAVYTSASTSEPGLVEHNTGDQADHRRARRRRVGTRATPEPCAEAGRLRDHAVGRRAARHLVQAVAQPDDEPGVGDHRRADRSAARRSAGAWRSAPRRCTRPRRWAPRSAARSTSSPKTATP